MRYLLDTHVLLWALFDPDRLSDKARGLLANPSHLLLVSSIIYWEISLKYAVGKLDLSGTTPDELLVYAKHLGIETLPVTDLEMAAFYKLPRTEPRDPFDRMIIWQAISQHLPLVSKDTATEAYRAFGLTVLWK